MKTLKGPVRPYLEKEVLDVLNEGMLKVAIEKPSNPLEYLGRYLIKRSKEKNY